MGDALNYEKLVGMLDIDNGEIVLVDNRESQAENFGKSREKYNKSREGTRKKVASDFIDKYNLNKSAEPGYNKKFPGLKVNENVHEEFYEDESSGKELEDEESEKGQNINKDGGEGRRSKKEEEELEFEDNSEYVNGSRDFENERSGKESMNEEDRNEVIGQNESLESENEEVQKF